MRWTDHWTGRAAACAVALCCVFVATTAQAQSAKSAKQSAKLEKAADASKAAVQDVLTGFNAALAGYNSIIDGTAKDSQKAYKKLVGDLKDIDKKSDGAKKQLASLSKEADTFFKAWEQDLQSISSESLRDKSAALMDASKKKYAEIGQTLTQAVNEFVPVVKNLNDQAIFLGRDMSSEAIADLSDEAAELNTQAEAATTKVKELIENAGKSQADAGAQTGAAEGATEDAPEKE